MVSCVCSAVVCSLPAGTAPHWFLQTVLWPRAVLQRVLRRDLCPLRYSTVQNIARQKVKWKVMISLYPNNSTTKCCELNTSPVRYYFRFKQQRYTPTFTSYHLVIPATFKNRPQTVCLMIVLPIGKDLLILLLSSLVTFPLSKLD